MTSKKAYSYLIKILSSRDFSEHKLREKLRNRNYSADEIDDAIAEVKAKNFLREDNYIEARIKAFMSKGYSPNYILQKLSQEHLNSDLELIHQIFSEHKISIHDQIDRLIRKKMTALLNIDYEDETRILRYLLSKGHEYSDSKRIMKSIISESLQAR